LKRKGVEEGETNLSEGGGFEVSEMIYPSCEETAGKEENGYALRIKEKTGDGMIC